MAKFTLECPSCGRINEASSFIFAKKKIPCACGQVIDIKAEKLTSRICPKCGNHVVFDQSKGEKAKCNVCGEHINTNASKMNMTEFICPQCTCNVVVDKAASSYSCPVCDMKIDVQKEIAKAKMVSDSKISVIKYEGDNQTFVWKHPIEDFNMGSQLIVHESQEAIFFRDGQALDLFPSGRYTLETQKLPVIGKLFQLPAEPNGVFHSEVYFINMTTQTGIRWGTDSRVRFIEPMTQMPLDLGASGEFNLRVSDSRKLLVKLVGTTDTLVRSQILSGSGPLTGHFRAMIMTKVKTLLAKTIKEQQINILEIDERLEELSNALRIQLDAAMQEYGLTIPEFYVTNFMTPDDDPNFRRMKQQHSDRYLKVTEESIRQAEAEAAQGRKFIEARTDAQLKIMAAQGDAEAYRLKAEAEAREMQMKGYTYQQETARQVGLAAMETGLGGGGSGSGSGSGSMMTGMVGDFMNLGIGLGAVSSVVGMTKEAMTPVAGLATDMKNTFQSITADNANNWECSCGFKNNGTVFCGNCGAKKPEAKQGWGCACGNKNITANFCGSCGAKKPEAKQGWDCVCGNKGITFNFCDSCGTKKPELKKGWDCTCGEKGITGKFCGNCGKREDDLDAKE